MKDELNKSQHSEVSTQNSPKASNSSFSTQHSKFTEAKLEDAIMSLLEAEGFPHIHGEDIPRASVSEVLINVLV